jgi:sugar lactone lactonase YvrE
MNTVLYINSSWRWTRRFSFAVAVSILLCSFTNAQAGSRPALWLANTVAGQGNPSCFLSVNTIAEYLPRDLYINNAPNPHLVNHSAALADPTGLAFDPSGNLWVISASGPAVVEYSQSQLQMLRSDPAPAPAAIITSSSLQAPNSLIFDHAGNLWVADLGAFLNPALFQFTPAQQATGGDLIPNLTITSVSLLSPGGMAMDHAGNLWVANVDQLLPLNALQFAAQQLSAGGEQSPNVTLGLDVQEPINVALDHKGNLWVNDWSGNRLLMFEAAALHTSGNPSPAVTITAATLPNGENSLASPNALAFDPSGNLWVSNSYPSHDCTGSLAEFTPAQLASSGNPVPVRYITVDSMGTSPVGVTAMVFGPPLM